MMRNSDFFAPPIAPHGRFPSSPDRFEIQYSKHTTASSMHNDMFGDTDSEGTPCSDFCFSEHAFHRMDNNMPYPSHHGNRSPSGDSFDQMEMSHHQQISQHAHQQFKCRQLPCRTFVSTGSCPYGERCVFLHDPSIVAKPVYIKTKRKSKDDTATDAFFWPTMSLDSVMGKVDNKNSKSSFSFVSYFFPTVR